MSVLGPLGLRPRASHRHSLSRFSPFSAIAATMRERFTTQMDPSFGTKYTLDRHAFLCSRVRHPRRPENHWGGYLTTPSLRRVCERMPAWSTEVHKAVARSCFDQQLAGILDEFFTFTRNCTASSRRRCGVVAEGHVHHSPDYDLTVLGNRALLDLVEAEDTDLRGVQDGRAEARAEHAAVRYRERLAPDFFERERAVLGTLGEVLDRRLDCQN